MNRSVFKYEIDQLFPRHGKAVHVARQNGTMFVWVEVEPHHEDTLKDCVSIVGTGHPIPDGAQYVGTLHEPPFVWHAYRREHNP